MYINGCADSINVVSGEQVEYSTLPLVKVVKMRWIEYSRYLKSSVCGVVVAGP